MPISCLTSDVRSQLDPRVEAVRQPRRQRQPRRPAPLNVPVGVIVATGAGGRALAASSIADTTPLDQGGARYTTGGCIGLIEIDLVCGTRLRVDAFVDEHALRRVLSAIKASS